MVKTKIEWLKRKYRPEFLNCTFLPVALERGTKALQFDVCSKAIAQTVECVCDRYATLRLDSLHAVITIEAREYERHGTESM